MRAKSPVAERHPRFTESRLFPTLFWVAVLATCLWVLSLPVFPSQDSPLHLYYINVFRQLLSHRPGVYADTYMIRDYLPPYATYYYSLVALGRIVSLEMADKIFVCACIVLFAASTRVLVQVVTGKTGLACFLVLPLLLNWPLMMGFVNFSLATSLALFSIALWCAGLDRPGQRYRLGFLGLVAAIVLTHPVPWLIVIGFVFFELLYRLVAQPGAGLTPARRRSFVLDLATAAVGCLPYVYLTHFKTTTQKLASGGPGALALQFPLTFAQQVHFQALNLWRTQGLDVFSGPGFSKLYRLGLDLLIAAFVALALWDFLKRRRDRAWALTDAWLLFSFLLLLALLVIPDQFAGGYFFTTRLQIMLYVSLVVASATVLERMPRVALALACFSLVLMGLTLLLCIRHITPVARDISQLRNAPSVPAGHRPGLAMQSFLQDNPPELTFAPFYWAPTHYFRQANLVLFNTAWMGDPIIPIRPRPEKLHTLDATFFNLDPQFGSRLMPDNAAARDVLRHVDLMVMIRVGTPKRQNAFAEERGSPTPGTYAADWGCVTDATAVWYLCRHPASDAPGAP